jgi:hypothetical protein
VTLKARWVTLRARRVTLRASLGDVQPSGEKHVQPVQRSAVPELWAPAVPASGEAAQQQLEVAMRMSRLNPEEQQSLLTIVSHVASGAALMNVGERADSTTVVEGAHEEGEETTLQAGRWVGWI